MSDQGPAGFAAMLPPVAPIALDIATSRATRSSMGGCVENSLSTRTPDSGLMMNICAEAGLRSAAMFGMRCAAPAIF